MPLIGRDTSQVLVERATKNILSLGKDLKAHIESIVCAFHKDIIEFEHFSKNIAISFFSKVITNRFKVLSVHLIHSMII
jgi:hypothetical protein